VQRILLTAAALLGLTIQGCGNSSPPPQSPTIVDINGGLSGSGTIGSLFVVDGTGFGQPAGANGYSLDFRDSTTNAVVATATVNFAAGDWKDVFIAAAVPTTLSASTTYKVTVTTPGGTSNAMGFLIVGSPSFSPSTISWTATSSLPVALQGFSTVVAPIGTATYIYAVGGNTAGSTTVNGRSASSASVYLNQLDGATGALLNASWTSTAALPAGRGFSAAVVANGFNSTLAGNGTVYLLGGLDGSGAATSTVYAAALGADGTIPATGAGAWAPVTSLPQPLYAHAAAIFQGRIYVVGGNDTSNTPVAAVYSASINSDGSLGAWATLASLPDKRAYHQLVSVAGKLYVVGGTNASAEPLANTQSSGSQSTVDYAAINLQDGTLPSAGWTVNPTGLGKAREKFTAVSTGGYLLLSGGLYVGATTGSSEESYAAVNADGSIASFNGATGSHTITGSTNGYNFFNQSTAYFVDAAGNPHVLILGGADVNTGAARAEVWYQH
jgi:Galactose oxidase, central domain